MAYGWTKPKRRFVNKMVGSTNILAFIWAGLGIRLRLSDELCGVYMNEARNLKSELTAILFRFFVKVLAHLDLKGDRIERDIKRKNISDGESYHSTLSVPCPKHKQLQLHLGC